MLRPNRAWVRPVSPRFDAALRPEGASAPDPALAAAQHRGYVAALEAANVTPIWLPASDAPDACFVEDCAVVLGASVLITRPGHPSRRPEVIGLDAHLPDGRRAHVMSAPATLDGGDVLRVGDQLWVGHSRRTNAPGIETLQRLAKDEGLTVHPVPVKEGLHMKSACSLACEGLLLVSAPLEPQDFAAAGIEVWTIDEPHGANVLALGQTTFVSAAAPRTAERLSRRGLDVVTVDVGELHAADGALTCLSVRFADPGDWAT